MPNVVIFPQLLLYARSIVSNQGPMQCDSITSVLGWDWILLILSFLLQENQGCGCCCARQIPNRHFRSMENPHLRTWREHYTKWVKVRLEPPDFLLLVWLLERWQLRKPKFVSGCQMLGFWSQDGCSDWFCRNGFGWQSSRWSGCGCLFSILALSKVEGDLLRQRRKLYSTGDFGKQAEFGRSVEAENQGVETTG